MKAKFVYRNGKIVKCCECDKDAGYVALGLEGQVSLCSDHSPKQYHGNVEAVWGYGNPNESNIEPDFIISNAPKILSEDNAFSIDLKRKKDKQ